MNGLLNFGLFWMAASTLIVVIVAVYMLVLVLKICREEVAKARRRRQGLAGARSASEGRPR